uniref:Uncharacterized protein n=1 Tax=Apteryx owenii TaxID=8824 RepID=A0A8B9QGL5_APTOW
LIRTGAGGDVVKCGTSFCKTLIKFSYSSPLLPGILRAVYKKKKGGEKKGGGCLQTDIKQEAAAGLAGGSVPACFFHIALLLQGLVLADYSSVASHFRFI